MLWDHLGSVFWDKTSHKFIIFSYYTQLQVQYIAETSLHFDAADVARLR